MIDSGLLRSLRYYAAYQLLYVAGVLILSSIGAFFHFLLNHEIGIVESWLHNNKWEILIISKLVSFFLLHRWFSMRLYQLKSLKSLVGELLHWPELPALVISCFMLISYLVLSEVSLAQQSASFFYYHVIAFAGSFLFFAIEFVVMAHLDDVLATKRRNIRLPLGLGYLVLFTLAFKMTVPDYYGHLPFVVFCFSTLLFLSGKRFTSWSNVVCFLLIFVAPMASLVGLDPVWGSDFTPFKVERKLGLSFLAVIWVISFAYYQFRDRFAYSLRKFSR